MPHIASPSKEEMAELEPLAWPGSDWANRQLSDRQIVDSANDAWAAIQVFHALGLPQRQD